MRRSCPAESMIRLYSNAGLVRGLRHGARNNAAALCFLLEMVVVGIGSLTLLAAEPGGTNGGLEFLRSKPLRVTEDSRFVSTTFSPTNRPPHHVTVENLAKSSAFGFALGGVGDMDGDGLPEVAISAPRYSAVRPEGGRLYLFRGSPEGLNDVETIVLDGPREGMQFGRSISEGIDINRDGFPDFLVGAPRLTGTTLEGGGTSLVYGGTNFFALALQPALRGTRSHSLFGASITVVGDVNGDGWPDILVGAPRWNRDQSEQGAAFLYLGSERGFGPGPNWSGFGEQSGAGFATSVAGVGDINRDGYDDVAVGAPHHHDVARGGGRVSLFFGSKAGLRSVPDWSFSGSLAREGVGACLAARGDLNGDDIPDLIVGAPGNGEKSGVRGRVYIFLGPVSGTVHPPDHLLEAGQIGAGFGYSVALPGDVCGDGTRALLVGSPYQINDALGQGRVYLYLMEKTTQSLTARCLFDGPTSQSRFGWTVGRAGDVNGDGLADFLIGSPYLADRSGTVGRVDLIYGSHSSFVHPEHFVATTTASDRPVPSPALLVTNAVESSSAEALRVTASRTRQWAVGVVAAFIGIATLLVAWGWHRQRRAARLAVQLERERLARDLHDNVAPELTRITLLDSPAASNAAQQALHSVGELVWATHPKNDPLEKFVSFLGDYATRLLEPTDLQLDLDLPAVPPGIVLDARVRQQLLSVVKEALHNIIKHSAARTVWLSLRLERCRLHLGVRDDGRGFDPTSIRPGANGLESMHARISELRGTMRITSTGTGTEIGIEVEV